MQRVILTNLEFVQVSKPRSKRTISEVIILMVQWRYGAYRYSVGDRESY